MTRERPTKYPGAAKALELLLKADGTEAETEAETATIVRSELAADGRTIAKTILRKTATSPSSPSPPAS